MTTFVHIGDAHVTATGTRQADPLRALDHVIADASGLERFGAWLWPGDLFDGVSTPTLRNALDERLRRMATVGPVLIAGGNHDKPGDLRGFANLSGNWPIVVVDDGPRTVRVRLATGEWASIWTLPYPHKAGLVSAGVAHGDLVATARDLFEPIFMVAADELERARRAGDLTLMVFHANVSGALTSAAGQPNIGRELEVTRAHLDRLGNIYKGGNHIHRPQEIHGAWYAGSIYRKDYGEVEEKRYLVVRVEADSSYAVESRSLDAVLPPMFHVEGRLSTGGFVLAEDASEEIRRRFLAGDWADAELRVRYAYKASERPVLDEAVIREAFSTALRLKVEGIAEADREVRAPEVARATTLTGKLAAMRPDRTLPPSVEEKVHLLEQQEPAVVLGFVDQWIADVEATADAGSAVLA